MKIENTDKDKLLSSFSYFNFRQTIDYLFENLPLILIWGQIGL